MDLITGQRVVITGATSGIGRLTALELVRRGGNVTIVCRNLEKGKATAAEIESTLGAPCTSNTNRVRTNETGGPAGVTHPAGNEIKWSLPPGNYLLCEQPWTGWSPNFTLNGTAVAFTLESNADKCIPITIV